MRRASTGVGFLGLRISTARNTHSVVHCEKCLPASWLEPTSSHKLSVNSFNKSTSSSVQATGTGLTTHISMANRRQSASNSSRFFDPIPRLVSKKQTVVVRMETILSHRSMSLAVWVESTETLFQQDTVHLTLPSD